jgi:benzoyl-CoA reductase/2-hydroxyglutaryl-CoA dehydratase subunit BcrC/BadD/HgdB
VIYHVLRGCHLNSLDATKAEMTLRRAGIPMIKVESEYDEGDVEQLRTRIEAFIEMIEARREFNG